MNKAKLLEELSNVANDSNLIVDKTKNRYLDYDVLEILEDFKVTAKEKNINYTIKSN